MTANTVTQVPILVNQCHVALVEFETAVEEAIYASYRFQRQHSPHVAPEQWALIFGDVTELEALYQAEQQIAALDALYEARRGTFPLTIPEVKAIGPVAVREFSRRWTEWSLAQRGNR